MEINRRIGKAATTMSSPTKRVWTNDKLTEHTKIQVYRACALSTLLYSSESWTLRVRPKKKLNAFRTRCLCRILQITWQDKATNNSVLKRAGIPSMNTLLKQRRMHWLGHVVRMDDGRISKDILYGELARDKHPRQTTNRQTLIAIQRRLQKGLEGHGYRPCRNIALWSVTNDYDL